MTLSPFSPRNKLIQANKSMYKTSNGKIYVIVPMFNRNGKLIRKQRVYLSASSPYKARAMHEIFPLTPKKRRPASPKRVRAKTPNKPKPKTPNKPRPKTPSPFKMPAFPGWP